MGMHGDLLHLETGQSQSLGEGGFRMGGPYRQDPVGAQCGICGPQSAVRVQPVVARLCQATGPLSVSRQDRIVRALRRADQLEHIDHLDLGTGIPHRICPPFTHGPSFHFTTSGTSSATTTCAFGSGMRQCRGQREPHTQSADQIRAVSFPLKSS